jgi:hypothetical protein
MTARPKPPLDYDENPPLDADFFARARPAALGDTARLRHALEKIIEAHESGAPLDDAISDARAALSAAE